MSVSLDLPLKVTVCEEPKISAAKESTAVYYGNRMEPVENAAKVVTHVKFHSKGDGTKLSDSCGDALIMIPVPEGVTFDPDAIELLGECHGDPDRLYSKLTFPDVKTVAKACKTFSVELSGGA